jgi:hypothetical protein
MYRYFLLLSFVLIIGGCTTAEIVNFPPMQPPPGVTMAQIETAIKTGINSFKGAWAIEESQAGRIIAGLHVRVYYLQVEISYSRKSISSRIINSMNLDQDHDSIHKRALNWQLRLDASINREVSRLSMPGEAGLKITEKTYPETHSGPGYEILKETTLETPEEADSKNLDEIDSKTLETKILETPDETDSKRTWKTYFEIQEEKTR